MHHGMVTTPPLLVMVPTEYMRGIFVSAGSLQGVPLEFECLMLNPRVRTKYNGQLAC
jgi:hypothetical protein